MNDDNKRKPASGEERRQTLKKKALRRRDFLKGAGLLGVAGILLNYGISHQRERQYSGRKILVTESCVGCTGCVTVCPTLAITVVPGGIAASDELCIRCGYCQAACATDGIRVLRPVA